MLRAASGATHSIEPRLIALLGVVSNHFGSRKLEIVSGFRPYSPSQHTAHSNHNEGKAVDFRIPGVPNEVLRDFCRTLKNVGVGYYPNSTFVHLDVRSLPAFWIDYSRAGEPPRYDAPNAEPDEGTSDVTEAPRAADPSASPDALRGPAGFDLGGFAAKGDGATATPAPTPTPSGAPTPSAAPNADPQPTPVPDPPTQMPATSPAR
jgi:hypothetical protein